MRGANLSPSDVHGASFALEAVALAAQHFPDAFADSLPLSEDAGGTTVVELPHGLRLRLYGEDRPGTWLIVLHDSTHLVAWHVRLHVHGGDITLEATMPRAARPQVADAITLLAERMHARLLWHIYS